MKVGAVDAVSDDTLAAKYSVDTKAEPEYKGRGNDFRLVTIPLCNDMRGNAGGSVTANFYRRLAARMLEAMALVKIADRRNAHQSDMLHTVSYTHLTLPTI